jgi:hypothetical protein
MAACAGILGLKPKNVGQMPFAHRAHTMKGVSCNVCHQGVSTAGESGPLHLPTTDTCRGCHTKPHDERACLGCHGEEHERQRAELTKDHLRFEHGRHVASVNGNCTKCHTAAGESRDVSLLPPMVNCFSCHKHEKQFAIRDCDGCHVDLPSEHVKPESHLVHDGDFVREHGVRAASSRDLCSTCHSERFCLGCHGVGTTPALPARLGFEDVRLSGLHRAGFKSRHAEESRNNPGLCTTCHQERTCRECHERENLSGSKAGGRSPHPRGWINPGRGGGEHGQAARLDPASCAGCHSGAGEQLCIGCHKVGGPGGNPHGPGFSSRKDKSRDMPCRLCHQVGP